MNEYRNQIFRSQKLQNDILAIHKSRLPRTRMESRATREQEKKKPSLSGSSGQSRDAKVQSHTGP